MMQYLNRKIVWFVTVLAVLTLGACENPLNPLDKSDKIRGLSYIDCSLTWERWDSDPEYDGVIVTMEYYNEFGDSLSFHGKPHELIIEFYTQKVVGGEKNPDTGNIEGGRTTYDRLIFSYPVVFSHADDEIRIPIEAYQGSLQASGYDLEKEDALVFLIVKVRPPQAHPLPELLVGYADQTVSKPPEADVTPNP